MKVLRPGRDALMAVLFLILTVALYWLPTGYEDRGDPRAVSCRGRVLAVDDGDVHQYGIVRVGMQSVDLRLLDGPFAGREVRGANNLLGKLELDKFFAPGDTVLVVLTLDEAGSIYAAHPQDHYRLRLELALFALFALLLLLFGGWTGFKSLLSFVFAAMVIWKIMIPLFLKGYDPVMVSLALVTLLSGTIIFMVGGLTRKGLTAFLGAFLGIGTACLMALYFTQAFRIHGAVRPFAETLLYSGFAHLDLRRMFAAAVFIGSSGAMMDLAMDVAASMEEVRRKKPDISKREALASGLRVGRAVVGTMTTTLLFAYSGGCLSLLMVFMAQGVPLANLFNLIYVAAEILNTLVGSFGLVMVAPFTALAGALVFNQSPRHAARAHQAAHGEGKLSLAAGAPSV
jgi:uncharacterized membrane protein